MTPTEALREMLDRSGMSMYGLSKAMGRSKTYVQTTIRRGTNIGSATLAEMARAMGYRLVLDGDGEPIEVEEARKNADSDQGTADQR